MTYQRWRKKNLKAALDHQIGAILRSYKLGQPTVILLPGGMGSELNITDEAHTKNSGIEIHRSDPIWIDLGITGGDAKSLTIKNSQDYEKRVVFPNGPLRFLTLEPYVHLKNFINDDKGWNYITFAYDWRMTLSESADQLLYFLSEFRRRVIKKHGKKHNPLPKTTLCCHSMGGTVAMTFLHKLKSERGLSAAKINKWFSRIITIATPFYGTSTHMKRYYEGIELLENFYSVKEMKKIVGSLPGPYSLMYLPKRIYDRHAKDFAKDKFPLKDYPMRDGSNFSQPADPYDPGYFKRYPAAVEPAFLSSAEQEMELVAAQLPKSLQAKIFNIRSGLKKWTLLNPGTRLQKKENCRR